MFIPWVKERRKGQAEGKHRDQRQRGRKFYPALPGDPEKPIEQTEAGEEIQEEDLGPDKVHLIPGDRDEDHSQGENIEKDVGG